MIHFTLNVHFEDDLIKLENDGAIHGQLDNDDDYDYYYLYLANDVNKLQILLTDMDRNIDNDLIMFINYDQDNDLSNNAPNFNKPNATNGAAYTITNGEKIFTSDVSKAGTYYISVYAANFGEHYYTILATTQNIVLI